MIRIQITPEIQLTEIIGGMSVAAVECQPEICLGFARVCRNLQARNVLRFNSLHALDLYAAEMDSAEKIGRARHRFLIFPAFLVQPVFLHSFIVRAPVLNVLHEEFVGALLKLAFKTQFGGEQIFVTQANIPLYRMPQVMLRQLISRLGMAALLGQIVPGDRFFRFVFLIAEVLCVTVHFRRLAVQGGFLWLIPVHIPSSRVAVILNRINSFCPSPALWRPSVVFFDKFRFRLQRRGNFVRQIKKTGTGSGFRGALRSEIHRFGLQCTLHDQIFQRVQAAAPSDRRERLRLIRMVFVVEFKLLLVFAVFGE